MSTTTRNVAPVAWAYDNNGRRRHLTMAARERLSEIEVLSPVQLAQPDGERLISRMSSPPGSSSSSPHLMVGSRPPLLDEPPDDSTSSSARDVRPGHPAPSRRAAASSPQIPFPPIPAHEVEDDMSVNDSIQQLLSIDGAIGAAIIDSDSGMALAQGGAPGFDLSIAAAGNSNVVRAKLATMSEIGLAGKIDDILITLDAQYHLINVLDTPATKGLFVYLVLERTRANLALARYRLTAISNEIAI